MSGSTSRRGIPEDHDGLALEVRHGRSGAGVEKRLPGRLPHERRHGVRSKNGPRMDAKKGPLQPTCRPAGFIRMNGNRVLSLSVTKKSCSQKDCVR